MYLTIEGKTMLQIQFLLRNTIKSRIGLICFYNDKMLVADSPEELHDLLRAIWG